jgi:homeobox-leucine zipper protein
MARLSPGCGAAAPQVDTGKYVRYTPEQVEALERVYNDCPKPTSLRRQQIIRDCPILSNIEPKQIKVWFQNRRSGTLLSQSLRSAQVSFFFAGNVGGKQTSFPLLSWRLLHLSACSWGFLFRVGFL